MTSLTLTEYRKREEEATTPHGEPIERIHPSALGLSFVPLGGDQWLAKMGSESAIYQFVKGVYVKVSK